MNINIRELAADKFGPPVVERINSIIQELTDDAPYLRLVVRTFVDATNVAKSMFLPKISTTPDKDFYYVKIDASANAVTIYPAGTDTIQGASSYALAAQYSSVTLVSNAGVWYVS